MKRRVLSLITALALCLGLCPVQVWAADQETDNSLCPHHPAHTDICGYVPPTPEQECTHSHDDGCYTIQTDCVHMHTDECDPDSCAHSCTQDSGCVTRTLSCPHGHDDACGYAPEYPGTPCSFVCKICPIDSLIAKLPGAISESNLEQAAALLSEIYDLYDGLTAEEQQLVDLSPCLSLQSQMDELGGEVLDSSADTPIVDQTHILQSDRTSTTTFPISNATMIDTNGYTISSSRSSAIRVTGTGQLYLMGAVTSKKGAGVEVQSGGLLCVMDPGTPTDITGTTYGLDIASGANVQLSAGRYTGDTAAIHAADGNYAALLAPGYVFFDANNTPISPENAASAKTLVVGPCPGHPSKSYVHNPGATTHTWTCTCKITETEPCTFNFQDDGHGTCNFCVSSLTISVDESSLGDLVYDGTVKPENIPITVTLINNPDKELTKDTDYKVDYEPRKDVGEITVTVTGITFNGTFTKTYQVTQDEPGIEWGDLTKVLDYDGRRTTIKGELPNITIKATSNEDLHPYIQYSYRTVNTKEFTDGLPLDAGTYEIKAYIPASQNYKAAETKQLLTLTINAIAPIITAPTAASPTYNRSAQALVTPGTIDPRATGAEILFATSETGDYSTEIPTGVNAGDYHVWYKVEGTNNYHAVGPAEITGVKIQRKPITPKVDLSAYTYQYDGGWKEPRVTVTDTDDMTGLPDTEYEVNYINNQNVSTAKNPAQVVVTGKSGGNYAITRVTVNFRITTQIQASLSITDKPNTVTYGDKFTLSTSGGSGNGNISWEITDGSDVAKVDENSGQITIIKPGTATVQATKSGVANYEDATASWTFTAGKKPVVATVTAEDKTYGDNGKTATIHAMVEQGVLPGDVITITDLTGEFSDANAGVGKTVTVNTTAAKIGGTNHERYDVSFSSATVRATIRKADAKITTPPVPASLTYNGTAQALIQTGAVVDKTDADVEYALNENGPYSTVFPEGTNAGKYTVWYRVVETGNYTGQPPARIEVEIGKKQVSPIITLGGNDLQTDNSTTPPKYSYVYDGTAKEPTVALTENDANHTPIPADQYTVTYHNNKNAGIASVTVESAAGGNYAFPVQTSLSFEIKKAIAQLTNSPTAKVLEYTGLKQELVTVGAAAGGHVEYALDNGSFGPAIPKAINAGRYVVTYKAVGDGSYEDSPTVGSVTVTIKPREVISPKITVNGSYTYDGNPQEPGYSDVSVTDGGTTIPGTEYTLSYSNNVNAGTATVHVINANGGNYIVNGTADFTIAKAGATVEKAPTGKSLPYNGAAQELIEPGATSNGTMVYSLSQAGPYSPAIPTKTAVGSYPVWYKVLGSSNYNDSQPERMTGNASIIINTVRKPTIQVAPESVTFNNKKQEPAVTVKDDNGFLIDSSEYTVTYTDKSGATATAPTNVGIYTVKIENKINSKHYIINDSTAIFTILPAGQTPLTITNTREHVYYGDKIQLGTTGGNGTVAWTVNNGAIASVDTNGLLTITGIGSVTVTATSTAPGYNDQTATWPIYVEPKRVTAIVKAKSKTYDGERDATVTATLQASDLVGIDRISIKLSGEFESASAGTDKKVNIDSSNPAITGDNGDKYAISYPATTTASILKANIDLNDPIEVTAPVASADLEYTSNPLNLVATAGTSSVGNIEYSLDGGRTYSASLPTGTDAGDYNIFYRVKGDSNHNDTDGIPLGTVSIAQQKVENPIIEFAPSRALYDSKEHKPLVTVKDKHGRMIPDSEYTVTYVGADWINVGKHEVKIGNKSNGNYDISERTQEFEIFRTGQNPLSIMNQPTGKIYYGDTFTLTALGGSGTGTVEWASSDTGIAAIGNENGLVTVRDVGGPVTITATRKGDGNYGDISVTWTFSAEKKVVTPTVTAMDREYKPDNTKADLVITWESGALVDDDSIDLSGVLTGSFDNSDAGNNKRVAIKVNGGTLPTSNKYDIKLPAFTTASITPAAASTTAVTEIPGLTYTGDPLALVNPGTATGGNLAYSLNGIDYDFTIPTGTEAKTYTVWYKVVASSKNYTDSDVYKVEVTIAPNTAGSDAPSTPDTPDTPSTPSTPDTPSTPSTPDTPSTPSNPDASSTPSTPGTVNTPMKTTIQNGTASTIVSPTDGSNLVKQALENQSQNVVIKPEITSNVSKTDVSIPSSTLSRIGNETNAALTVSTHIADVTIPNAALDTLSSAGNTVSVAAEQKGQTVVMTLSADNKPIESVPGGVTLTVPVEEPSPGTVAVLVHDDGTRETIRKSIVEDGKLSIPLDGSATVEIVDNSKEFTDVAPTSWEADAVAFASAHELFNGTSETTFSPDQTMSRGMLATVLYNLEGQPDQEQACTFSDINSDAWYTDGIIWAAANGITNGYSDGQFGPNDSISREQFAVMLWRYAGSPETSGGDLSFTDADQISGYALDALRWAAANGILSGYGNGRLDPGGTATRAQAAQMLKNFLENT